MVNQYRLGNMNRRRKQYYMNRLPLHFENNAKGKPVVIEGKFGELADLMAEFFWEFHEKPDEKYDELGSDYANYRLNFIVDKLRLGEDAKKKKSSSA